MTREEEDKIMKECAARMTAINKELQPYRDKNVMMVVEVVLPLIREYNTLVRERNKISNARRERLKEMEA